MNQKQKYILIAVVVVVVAMFIYPPFQAGRNGTVYNMGYGWIFALSRRGYMTVNVSMLIIQWIGVLVVGGIAFFLTKGTSLPAELSSNQSPITTHSTEKMYLTVESSSNPDNLNIYSYAGFWKRVAASIIDAIILTIGFTPIAFIFYTIFAKHDPAVVGSQVKGLGLIFGWLYYVLMESSAYQGTIGKMFLGIKVTDLNGNRIGFGRANGRYFGRILPPIFVSILSVTVYVTWGKGLPDPDILIYLVLLSGLLFFAGVIIVAFTEKKQGLHDIMAGCLVVNRSFEYATNEDAAIEKIISEAEARTFREAQRTAPHAMSEVKQQNEEFVALLKSTINENGLNTIPGDDLIEIYNRAKATAGSSNEQDMELSDAINILSEEIKKRGLPQESKPQEKEPQDNSDYKESSSRQNKADGIFEWNWGFVIIGLIIVIAVTIVLFGLKSNYQNQEAQDTEAVAKTQDTPQELTADGAGAYNQNIDNLSAAEWFERGYGLSTSGNHTEAVKAYSKAIALNPQLAAAYYNRGGVYRKLGNYQQAIQDFNKAIELNPLDADAYNRRGNAYGEFGNSQQAIKDYNKAIELNPQHEAAYYNRGGVYRKLGDTNQAIENHKIAARLGHQGAQDFLRSEGIEW